MSELRPCPQCGATTKKRSDLLDFWDCTECEMELFDDYRSWWCWKEIDRLKQNVHDLTWNLSGCSLLALGHQVSTVFSKELARPALFDVQKMAKQNEKMREALEKAFTELNIIRARDGVPYTHIGCKSDVDEQYFSSVVDEVKEALKGGMTMATVSTMALNRPEMALKRMFTPKTGNRP